MIYAIRKWKNKKLVKVLDKGYKTKKQALQMIRVMRRVDKNKSIKYTTIKV